MKKTFIFDMDGTLYTSELKILPESKAAIQAIVNNGDEFILASGRTLDALKEIALEKLPVKPIFLIASNGAITYDVKRKKIHRERKIPKTFINSLINHDEINKQKIIFHTSKGTFGLNLNQKDYDDLKTFSFGSIKSISKDSINQLERISMVELLGWKAFAWSKHKNWMIKLVQKHKLEIIDMGGIDDFIDIMPEAGSKGQALSLLDIEGVINKKYCYAFGDGLNDIEMLQFAKNSYAMVEALPEVKSNAKNIIGSNNEASIANKILEILKRD